MCARVPSSTPVSCCSTAACNIFDNAPAQRDLGFGYTVTFDEGFRRGYMGHEQNNKIEDVGAADPTHDRVLHLWQHLIDHARH
jgi:hypothetical protein